MKNKINKLDLLKSWAIWMNFSHSCYSYDRLQGLAYGHCMLPIIKKLYSEDKEKINNLKKHMEFFNTEPNIGTPIHGYIISLEEKISINQGEDNISSIKKALMGSMAGMGDSITQTVYTPVMLVVAMLAALNFSIMGVILSAIVLSAIILYYSFSGWMNGYYQGQSAIIKRINNIKNHRMIKIFPMLFCLLFAPVVLKAINIDINLSKSIVDQNILKYILIPISGSYYFLLKKGINEKYLIYSIYIVPVIIYLVMYL